MSSDVSGMEGLGINKKDLKIGKQYPTHIVKLGEYEGNSKALN